MRRWVPLLMLPSLIWFLTCSWYARQASWKSWEAWDEVHAKTAKLRTAEDRFYVALSISAAQARAAAQDAESDAMHWMGIGALTMMVTVTLLASRLLQCEKRVQKLEEELTRQRAA